MAATVSGSYYSMLQEADPLQIWVDAGAPGEKRMEAAALISTCRTRGEKQLDLSGLALNSVPDMVGELDLEVLNLGDNNLSDLPDSLAQLTHLHVLTLAGNVFETVPEVISELHALVDLNLMDNALSGCADAQFPPRLLRLDLCNNPLQEVPDAIFLLLELRTLDLSYTAIETVPAEISALTSLDKLNLSFVVKMALAPAGVLDLGNTCEVDLSHTALSKTEIQRLKLEAAARAVAPTIKYPQVDTSREALSERHFCQVTGEDAERMAVMTDIFNRVLEPLYGPQEGALAKIAAGEDRVSYLLYEGGTPVGVLVFKSVLSDEFAEFGVEESVEVKSLFLDASVRTSGRGLGSSLVTKLKDEVAALNLGERGIHVTVSETKEESLNFFKKKGFRIVHAWEGRYRADTTEYLLFCPQAISRVGQQLGFRIERSPQELTEAPPSGDDTQAGLDPHVVSIVRGAHFGRIHGLIPLPNQTFVSGSEDNCIYQWGHDGQRVNALRDVELSSMSEKNWITGMTTINERYWASGQRNGVVTLWNSEGQYVKELKPKLPAKRGHVSHKHNLRRVNCLAGGGSVDDPSLYIGFPTMFDRYSLIEGRTVSYATVHKNDWVYALQPLDEKSVLTVIGCNIERWVEEDGTWTKAERLVEEPKRPRQRRRNKRHQRPFISALTSVEGSTYAYSAFDGSVTLIDVTNGSVMQQWKEHTGRVWDVKPISETLLASCGEDGTIRFWDVNQSSSVGLIDCGMQVNALAKLDAHHCVAGVGPDETSWRHKTGDLHFLDLRA